ncbi:hypothetical protein Bbelb_393670 [Branchiostoma belcheri]|nr:hypothetical protein Bbelb_393670 [Branchiostoma belcheri]
MATTAAKVLQATVMVAVTATIQDATRAAMSPRNDGAEDIRNHGDSGGQVSYGTGGKQWFPRLRQLWRQRYDCKAGEVTPVVGSSDDPGRDKGSDDSIEAKTSAITATAAATFLTATAGVSADPVMWKSSAFTETAAPNVFSATAVIAATAIIEDAAGAATAVVAAFSFPVAITETTAAKILEATVVVAATAIIQDATRACDGSEDCGIYGDSGGNISYGDGDARGGDRGGRTDSYDPGRDEVGDVAYKTITSWIIGTMVTDATAKSDDAENCGNYGDSFYSDRGGRGGSDHPGFDEGGKVALEAMTAVVAVTKVADGSDGAKDFGNSDGSGCEASEVTAVVDGSDDPGRVEGSDDRMVPKTVAIMPKSAENFVTATAVVAAVVDNPRRDESDDVT